MSRVGQDAPHTVGLTRIGRAGLGNELFAWARCRIWCLENGHSRLKPQWRQVHIGPYLRRERDKRHYQRLFEDSEAISGFSKLRYLSGASHVDEDVLHKSSTFLPAAKRVVVFSGMRDHFAPLWGRQTVVAEQLLVAARRVDSWPAAIPGRHVAIHVRCGDFAPAAHSSLIAGVRNTRAPLEC